jgi:hypothetical protein
LVLWTSFPIPEGFAPVPVFRAKQKTFHDQQLKMRAGTIPRWYAKCISPCRRNDFTSKGGSVLQLFYNNKLEAFGKIRRRIAFRLVHRMDYFFLGLLIGFVLGAMTIFFLLFLFFPK